MGGGGSGPPVSPSGSAIVVASHHSLHSLHKSPSYRMLDMMG